MTQDELVEIGARALYADFRIEKEMTGEGCTSFDDHARLHPEINEPYWEAAEAILSALSARGLAVVPVEPTPEMVEAGNSYDSAGHSWGQPNTKHGLGEYIYNSDGVYAAMLAALPKEGQ